MQDKSKTTLNPTPPDLQTLNPYSGALRTGTAIHISLAVCTEPEQQGLDLQGLFDRIGKF